MQYILSIILLFIVSNSFSQLSKYDYKADVNGVTDTWHTIKLPLETFSLIKNNYADIRIYGVNDTDTIEIPYIKEVLSDKKTTTKIPISIINKTKSAEGSFFTIKNKDSKELNEIELLFNEDNFDWTAKVEGSNNGNDWFVISEEERLVSLKKNAVNFTATDIVFPSINYKFIRVLIKDEQNATINSVLTYDSKQTKGESIIYNKKNQSLNENKENQYTSIAVQLEKEVPVSKITIPVESEIDYYRKVNIKTLIDSIVLENKTKYNYSYIGDFEISSYKKNELLLNNNIVNNLIIEIENKDNLPLPIGDIAVSGNPVILKARFPKDNYNYVLAVGNKNENIPSYDITSFKNNIPEVLNEINVGKLLKIKKEEFSKSSPILPFPKYVLWIILLSVIIVLGFFTFKMFKK